MGDFLCPGCDQPMLPPGEVKRPNEYDHASGCPRGPSAVLSAHGTYRYRLFRPIRNGGGAGGEPSRNLCWIMLNPSIADATKDDPTIRKVRGFTERAGYDGFVVVNLFAYRATDPRKLRDAMRNSFSHAVGPDNQSTIEHAVNTCTSVVCAWGAQPWARDQARRVFLWVTALRSPVFSLATTKRGDPGHPLMLSYEHTLKPFVMR